MLGLSEVNDARPFVIALWSESSVPLRNILLSWQSVIELVNNVTAFLSSSLRSVSFCGCFFNNLVFRADLMFFDNLSLHSVGDVKFK